MNRTPSMQALRAVESVARLGTIWQAAEELNLTRSAISHQLRLLERDIGFPLMDRIGNRVELTVQGLAYAEDVRRALSLIAASASRNAQRGISGSLTISCPPGFASSWLCLHIDKFLDAYPDLLLTVVTPQRLGTTSNPEVDTFITFDYEHRPGVQIEPLQPVESTPLCSPAYLNRFDGFPDTESMLRARLLHINDFNDWESWMRMHGLPPEYAHQGICYSDMTHAYTAVLASQGIAMGDVIVWQQAMEEGLLIRPFDVSLPLQRSYYLCTPLEKMENLAVSAFRDWLRGELQTVSALSRLRRA
ncbi:LysR family transcriptional regulator [Thioclava sp. BHET1]|nr:LysR family transcriptional regulator [Thioclava sp. BHET1]